MSAGKTIIGGATPSRIGERISFESASPTLPVRKAPQSHSSQARSVREARRAPPLRRPSLAPLIAAFATKMSAPANHRANSEPQIIGRLAEGLTLTAGNGL